MWAELGVYSSLFAGAFVAASVLTFPSEPFLISLVLSKHYNLLALWLVATAGNTAGAVLNWWLARYLLKWQDRRWFPASRQQLERASGWFRRYGVWTLLLAWTPIIGDALTVVAGLMRVPLGVFILLVGIGKAARYIVVVWSADTVLSLF